MKFWETSSRALYYAVGWAVSTYYDRPLHIKLMQQLAMQQSFKWEDSAKQYERVYLEAMKIKQELL